MMSMTQIQPRLLDCRDAPVVALWFDDDREPTFVCHNGHPTMVMAKCSRHWGYRCMECNAFVSGDAVVSLASQLPQPDGSPNDE